MTDKKKKKGRGKYKNLYILKTKKSFYDEKKVFSPKFVKGYHLVKKEK